LKAEIHLLDSDKSDLENEISQKAAKAKAKLDPEIWRMEALIKEVNEEMA